MVFAVTTVETSLNMWGRYEDFMITPTPRGKSCHRPVKLRHSLNEGQPISGAYIRQRTLTLRLTTTANRC